MAISITKDEALTFLQAVSDSSRRVKTFLTKRPKYHGASDTLDADAWFNVCTDDMTIRFGNSPEQQGLAVRDVSNSHPEKYCRDTMNVFLYEPLLNILGIQRCCNKS